jgi:methylenetetrahydrofolate reductase (NADPH)
MEIFPRSSVSEQIRQLPKGTTVPVTSSPTRGIEATLDLCEKVAGHGLRPVPHISARLVADGAHLNDILERLVALHDREIFVVGGDSKEPRGPFPSASALLAAIRDSKHEFDDVGIAAYPEGHPFISDDELLESLHDKQPFASYMVTQMCFDAKAIIRWVAAVRGKGIRLPLYIGIPGDVDAARLLRIALRIGVGDSARFLKNHTGLLMRLLRPTYHPDRLVKALAPQLANESYDIRGLHIYTFDQVEATEQWRKRTIARLESQPA